MTYDELLLETIKNGIDVTQHYDKESGSWYADLKFGAKSHGYLYDEDSKLVLKMRYDKTAEVEEFLDLCWLFKSALCGRDYGNPDWFEACVKHGVMQKQVETKTSYV